MRTEMTKNANNVRSGSDADLHEKHSDRERGGAVVGGEHQHHSIAAAVAFKKIKISENIKAN